ncbi:MAG: phosphoribosyltransferase, partial [Mesorhizobium sp.]
ICGKTVIIVDDGAATGTTMKVAIRALKRRSPRQIVVALPVASPETLTDLAYEADWTVCLSEPAHFRALSQNYLKFPQLSDDDVVSIWDEAARVQNTGRRGNPRRDGDAAADGDTATAKE